MSVVRESSLSKKHNPYSLIFTCICDQKRAKRVSFVSCVLRIGLQASSVMVFRRSRCRSKLCSHVLAQVNRAVLRASAAFRGASDISSSYTTHTNIRAYKQSSIQPLRWGKSATVQFRKAIVIFLIQLSYRIVQYCGYTRPLPSPEKLEGKLPPT